MKLRVQAKVLNEGSWEQFGDPKVTNGKVVVPWEEVANAAVEYAGADDIYMIHVDKSELDGVWVPHATFGPYGLMQTAVPAICTLAVGG